MKVYIVVYSTQAGGDAIYGVFSTKQKADEYVGEQAFHEQSNLYVDEHEVDYQVDWTK